jgi:hypothetical protein
LGHGLQTGQWPPARERDASVPPAAPDARDGALAQRLGLGLRRASEARPRVEVFGGDHFARHGAAAAAHAGVRDLWRADAAGLVAGGLSPFPPLYGL